MDPLAVRLDRFIRWFFSSSPSDDIERVGRGDAAVAELPLISERQSKKSASAVAAVEVHP